MARPSSSKAGVTTETPEEFVDVLRRMMADFSSPFVPELPRFTGGAVGYLGYDTAAWFEPVTLQNDGQPDPALQDEAGFMIFDTVLAFDHVQHRILIIANARITPDDDLEALYQFACTKIDFLERELRRDLSHPQPRPGSRHRRDIERAARAVSGDGEDREGVHRGRRHLSGRAVAAIRSGDHARIRLPCIARFVM